MSEETKVQGPDQIREMAGAFQRSRVLLSAFDLGVFTAIGDSELSADQVAGRVGADNRAADRLLNALTVLGLLEKRAGLFRNTEAAARCLVKGSPDYMAGLGHTSNMYHGWSGLTEALRAGSSENSVRRRHDEDDGLDAFIAAMHHRARGAADRLAAMIGLSGVGRVLDVGGGSGIFSMAFCLAEPGLRAVILDLPKVAGLARAYVAEAGLSERVEVRAGDFHSADFGSGFDLVLLSAIVHMNSADENRALLAKAYAALNPGGRVAIEDFVMDEDRVSPGRGAIFALNMLVHTEHGDTYTESEIRSWLQEAGFLEVSRTATGPGTSLMTGRRPG
ncbi:MAG: methyltransferase domain-containing protein [Desulfovibrionaceae bacterium]|nr:methyltransferase domain-containing protein [Desulfovibrionaceae bacterium]